MKIDDALASVSSVFLDTAPVIYYVQSAPLYRERMDAVVAVGKAGRIGFVTSPITLAECLVLPIRTGDTALVELFRNVLRHGLHTRYASLDGAAEDAAELRAHFNLTLLDALQVACARNAGCDAFLTNDHALARVPGLRIFVLDDLVV